MALLAISALTTGLAAGRKLAGREIDRRRDNLIEQAAQEAQLRIRERARLIVRSTTAAFLRRVLIKALILSVIWLLFWAGAIGPSVFRWSMSAAIGTLVIWDIYLTWPTLRLIAVEIRKHGLRPKKAISELVAAEVFEQVLTEIDGQTDMRWHQKLVLSLAGRDLSQLSLEIAGAVAEVSRKTSWKDVRPFMWSGILHFMVLSILYSSFATLMMLKATSIG